MKAYQWIDRVKVAKNLTSDYAVAKVLGLSQSSVITIRTRKSTMDDETASKVAEALGMNPAGVILDQAAERVKSEAVRATLHREVERLCILCKVSRAIKKVAIHARSVRPSGENNPLFSVSFA